MSVTFDPESSTSAVDADRQLRRNQSFAFVVYAAIIFVGLAVAALAYKRAEQLYFGFAVMTLILIVVGWVRFPRAALGCTVFLALTGDIVTVSWFPFNKNLSSPESLLYLADAAAISPLELVLGAAILATCYRNIAESRRLFQPTPLSRPMLLFLVCVVVGFGFGISQGGDLRVAIFEVRPLLYLPALYLVITSVCRSRSDYRAMLYAALAAIFAQALLSLVFLFQLPAEVRGDLEDLNEHGAAIGMNLLFLAFVVAMVYRRVPIRLRITLFVMALPALWVYFVAQRRAAIVALGAAILLLAMALFWRQRRTFWRVIPVVIVVSIGYIGAFWNSESGAAFPAQAVKTVIAPDQVSGADESSNLYRELEKLNLNYTIQSSPLLGLGFGRAFLRPIPLPDISTFEFHPYIPHNSLLWVWIKTGFIGFATLLYMLARSVSMGAERVRSVKAGSDAVVATLGVSFVAMYSIFLYVDIAWEPRNVLLLALTMAICTGPLRVGATPDDPSWDPPDQASRRADTRDVGRRDKGHTTSQKIDQPNRVGVASGHATT